MANSSSEIQLQLNQLRQDYIDRLPDKLQTIAVCWQQLSAYWETDTADRLYRLVHTLTGSSATFGLTNLSETARQLEQLLQQSLVSVLPDQNLPVQVQIEALLQRLHQQAEVDQVAHHKEAIHAIRHPLAPGSIAPVSKEPESSERSSSEITSPARRLIYLVEADPNLAQELALQMGCFGYEVVMFNRIADLRANLMQIPPAQAIPAAVILDSVLLGNSRTDAEIILDLKRQYQTLAPGSFARSCPILITSTQDEFNSRLQAVRSGGDSYFTKPINVNEFVDQLDALTGNVHSEAYRILIVEDDRAVAEFHALTLQEAGMFTQIVSDPLNVMSPLSDFKPDLILMDVYMPSCSGLELATVIRQQPAYVSIPIVFLSSETDLHKQLAAMSLGGDDFLTKPIQPEHLVSSVVSRTQRSTTLRAFMVRDSLTGLFNHTKIKEQLAIELKRAVRQQRPLAFAMLDIDHFKRVNDTHGHPVGDRVIKSLSRLLKQRLRQTDVVGRYGGEEFAVIFTDTDGETAVKVFDKIRHSFSQVQQRTATTEFTVTFSCGIAAFPAYADITQLSDAADQALYQAKGQGRNQVVLAAN